jgi:23S rRNA pseudouridine1911/1915/1917 synthase
MGEPLSFVAGPADAGQRLDRFLAGRAGLARTRVQALVRAGRVRACGRVIEKPAEPVEAGARYALEEAEEAPPAGPALELAVLHADLELVALDKPAGMLVHATGAERAGTLAALAEARFGPLPSIQGADRPGIVHRLDRETSGVIVLGRTERALLDLKRQFQERTVEKTYLALVEGEPRFESDWIEAPLGRPAGRRDRQAVVPEGEGRPAATFWEVRERFLGFALLACTPRTGRTHQIRVHLSHAGLPIVGDRLYRPRGRPAPSLPAGAPPLARQALHAQALALDHPADRRRVRFEAPLPADLAAVLAFLRG